MDSNHVAAHYNERRNEGRKGRKRSPIYHMRQFNNWLKSVLIKLHTRPGYAVLDLCCGKGGDLQKWVAVGCTEYVACDVAEVSVNNAAERYNSLKDSTFRPVLLVGDCFSVVLNRYLPPDTMFDVVSCQFAIHYAFESEQRVRTLLQNVTDRLKPGGFFIGTTVDSNVLVRKFRAVDGVQVGSKVCHVRLDESFSGKTFKKGNPYGIRYFFTLSENVEDCPEFLVHFPSFEKLALEYDLELLMNINFHDFYSEFMSDQYPEFRDLFFTMNVVDDNGTMSPDEWDAIYLYTAFAFRRKGQSPSAGLPPSEVRRRQWPPVPPEEIIVMQ